MAKIYTRTGDQGQTSLVGGSRVPKTHPRLEAYGTIDEFTSHLGLLITMTEDTADRAFLTQVQQTLFDLSTILATEPESKYQPTPLGEEKAKEIEDEIDRIQSQLPPLHAFILPGGTMAAAQAHVCRTVCRRAERRILALSQDIDIPSEVLRYINRLSDYLFLLARKINAQQGHAETEKHF